MTESIPEARTLCQAHLALEGIRPALDAPASEWRRYYLRSARVYAEVAEIDRAHHHEARYWADRERRKAEEIERTGVHEGPGRTVRV
ncbi:AMED_5909 family protein [Saccharomonospora azurea]|uniref:AMED_5909 family protein n=1 Tax=Saccharomonospora azurea TaxID=40988 RepID=UPI0002F1FEE4|nr:AMED_5909 family protein [Saccharomonospora azurea]